MSKPLGRYLDRPIVREAGKGLGVLGLLIVMMMWLAGAFVQKVDSGPPAPKPKQGKFNTVKAERRVYPLIIDQVGTLRAQNEAQVSSRILAQVKEILVREGDSVAGSDGNGAPTVMARLDDRDIQAKLRQAQSQSMAMDRAVAVARAKVAAARAQVESTRATKGKELSDYRRYQDLKQRAGGNRPATGACACSKGHSRSPGGSGAPGGTGGAGRNRKSPVPKGTGGGCHCRSQGNA